jgi:protein SCO1
MNRRELFTAATGTNACAPMCVGAQLIPNVLLRTHEGAQVRFYDDLVKGKQVLINMMYVTCEGACPAVTTRLVDIHRELAHRMGKDLFMYSITLKPEEDGPAALKAYAEMHGALLPGWTFLTGDPFDIQTLRFALFRHDHIKFDLDLNGHTGKLRIINDAINRWLHVPPLLPKESVLKRIAWADPPKGLAQRLRANEQLQREIDKEMKLYGYRKVI